MKMRKRPYQRRRKARFFRNRHFVGTLVLCLLGVVTMTFTYAWSSYTEWTKNHMQSEAVATEMVIKINEAKDGVDFTSNLEWQLGTAAVQTKDVKIQNIRSSQALVRLSLKEILLPFVMTYEENPRAEIAVNQYAYGDVLEITGNPSVTIRQGDTTTWQAGGIYQKSEAAPYYRGKTPLQTPSRQIYPAAERNQTLQKIVQFNYNLEKIKTATQPPTYTTVNGKKVFAEKDFWYYDQQTGYFYYSEILDAYGGAKSLTTPVLKSLTLNSYENQYKQALYGIDVVGEGIRPIASGLESTWISEYQKQTTNAATDEFFAVLKASLTPAASQ